MGSQSERDRGERWQSLFWQQVTLTKTRSGSTPFRVADAPRGAGIYRITWVGGDWNCLSGTVPDEVAGSPSRVGIDLQSLIPPVLLMVGAAEQLATTIGAQLGKNHEKNALFQRLRAALPGRMSDPQIRNLAEKNLRIECAKLEDRALQGELVDYARDALGPVFTHHVP